MHPYLNIAIKAARRAGTIITRSMEQLDKLRVYEKGLNDLVTSVDRAVEEDIIETIYKAYPNHAIIGEETGEHPGEEFTWVIDPIDGTLNFVHGFPQFCVSIAVLYQDSIEHGVIYDPISQDLYTASRGRGAQVNGRKIRVSEKIGLTGLILGKTLPFVLVGYWDLILVTGAAMLIFHVPFNGSFPLLLFAAFVFLLTTLGAGLFISTISRTQQQAMMATTLFFQPFFMLSGFTFPIRNMPEGVQWLTYVNPVRYFMEIVRGVFLQGAGIDTLWPQVVALAVFGVIILGLSVNRFHKQLE